jgi:hypothetical protein
VTETVGATFGGSWCNFAPGASVTFVVNGSADGPALIADSKGCVTFTASVTDPHLAVNGGTPIPAHFGPGNTIAGTGAAAGGGSVTNTEFVTIVQTAAPATTPTSTSSSSSGLAFTGADVAGLVIGAAVLLALGFGFVTVSRRRKAPSSTE